MFFVAAKLFWLLAAPLHLATILGLATLIAGVCRWRRLARGLGLGAIITLVLAAATPLGPLAAARLEGRFPLRPALPAQIAGILVLGGGISNDLSLGWGMPVLARDADRLTALLELGRRFPDAPVIYAGGYGGLGTVEKTEGDFARDFLVDQGFDLGRVRFDTRSRNSFENALEAGRLAGKPADDGGGPPWVLVTGALHMPRAVATFRHAGWSVIPWPVAPISPGPRAPFWAPLDMTGTLEQSSRALREWLGLLAYRAAGYTDRLLPE